MLPARYDDDDDDDFKLMLFSVNFCCFYFLEINNDRPDANK